MGNSSGVGTVAEVGGETMFGGVSYGGGDSRKNFCVNGLIWCDGSAVIV